MYYGIPLKFKMGSHYHPISNFPTFIPLSHCYPTGIWLPGASGLNAIETPPIWQTAKINKKTYCVQFFFEKSMVKTCLDFQDGEETNLHSASTR